MHGCEQHVVAVIKDRLRAVSVMRVEIEDGHFACPLADEIGGNGGIVEEAEAGGAVGECVMSRWAAQRECGGGAIDHRVRRGQCRLRQFVDRLQVPAPMAQLRSPMYQPPGR